MTLPKAFSIREEDAMEVYRNAFIPHLRTTTCQEPAQICQTESSKLENPARLLGIICARSPVKSLSPAVTHAPIQHTSSAQGQGNAFIPVSDVMDILNVNMVMMRILMTVGKHMKQMMEFQNTKYLNLPSLDALGSCIPN